MAGSSSDDERRRHRRCPASVDPRDAAEPEEGELVPGCDDDSDMNTDDYYNNHDYYNSSSDDTDETTSDCNAARSRSLVVPASYGGAATPSSSSSSSAAAAAAAAANNTSSSSPVVAAPAAVAVFACPTCGKEFRSSKAVCGHMKVHQQHGATVGHRHEQQQQGIGIGSKDRGIKRNAAVTGSWGGTGKRGCAGCWSKPAPASPNQNARSDQSMAIVVANPNTNPSIVLQPMHLAFVAPNLSSSVPMASSTPNPSSNPIASTMTTNVSDESSSAKPKHSDAIMETVVAGAANPPPTETEAVVHLRADAARAPPSPPPAEVHATSVHQHPIAPPSPPPADAEEEQGVQLPPVHHHPNPIAPPLGVAGRQNPNGYTCKQCGVWFAMHQGLGGHMAGHKTRELAAAVPCHRDAKPEKVHVCKICAAEFPAGVQLGGHMRKHYTGAPIVPKKKQRVVVQPLPPPAEQGALEPAPKSARVLLFGVDIAAAAAQTPAAKEGCSSASQDPSSSTGGEQ